MSKYVMSDIHGMYDKFLDMLKLINFTNEDELYILGDLMDRGPAPIQIIDYVVGHKNMHLIKGNHEDMFRDYFESGDSSLWYYNGGSTTLAEIVRRGYDFEYSLYRYIRSLPTIKVVDKFILVHAGLYIPKNYNDLELDELLSMQEEEINLWTRDHIYSDVKYRDYTIICGHNTVQSIVSEFKDPKILHREGQIFIDCGCCFESGKLACLRLDDMEEFYV